MNSAIQEEWRPVVGFEGFYEVSNLGAVKRVAQTVNNRAGKVLSPGLCGKGYNNQRLCVGGVHKSKTIHRMVAEAFIPNPENKPVVNHKNGIKRDNRSENLEWVTLSENSRHGIHVLGKGIGVTNGKHKLTPESVLRIRQMIMDGVTHKAIAEQLGVHKTSVTSVNIGRTWSHLTKGEA